MSENTPYRQNPQNNAKNDVSITDIIFKSLSHWPWFILSIAISLSYAYYLIHSQENVYARKASILIKSSGKSGVAAFGTGSDMGMFRNSSEADNELVAIQSPTILAEVANRLKMYMIYQTDGFLHRTTLYGKTLPIEVDFKNVSREKTVYAEIELSKDGTFEITHLTYNKEDHKTAITGKIGQTVSTPIGKIAVTPTKSYAGRPQKLYVTKITHEAATRACISRSAAAMNGKQSSIIDLECRDVSIERATDFLNTQINVYNETWIKDKNQLAVSTSRFIDERLAIIQKELGEVDTRISQYKSTHRTPDFRTSGNMNFAEASETEKKLIDLNNQIYIMKYMADYMRSGSKNKVLPLNTGISAGNIEGQIKAFNDKLLRRNALASNSSDANPLVKEATTEVNALYTALETSIENQIHALATQLQATKAMQAKANNELSQNPEQSKHLLGEERQQTVKEDLYIFLLQKREENELSQAFTAYNTRIITEPYGSSSPVAPLGNRIMLCALAIGLALPIGIIYLMEILNTTVRGRRDIEDLNIPFAGEIPQAGYRKMTMLQRMAHRYELMLMHLSGKKASDSQKKLAMVVKPNNHNSINEAFRVVRGNLEFIRNQDSRVMAVTSSNPGSGKTFISLNLAASFAINKKKVLLIDLDMRKRSLSNYFRIHHYGIADYLAHHVDDYHELINKNHTYEGLDVIVCGSTPPNPSELLYDPRLEQMIKSAEKEYDLILIDCPPIEIVTDVSVIAPLTDKVLFIIRTGLFHRDMLPELERIHEERKYGNLAIILNGSERFHNKYGYGRYGYGYGYGYGTDGNEDDNT